LLELTDIGRKLRFYRYFKQRTAAIGKTAKVTGSTTNAAVGLVALIVTRKSDHDHDNVHLNILISHDIIILLMLQTTMQLIFII
jgi:hypothetical protein